MIRTLVVCAAVFAGAVPQLGAEVSIKDVGWQLALQVRKQKRNYHDIESWLFPPSQTVKLKPRAVVTLANSGDKTENAVLLRYSFSARLRRIGEPGDGKEFPLVL